MVMCHLAIDGETICVGLLLPDGTDCGIRRRCVDMGIMDFTEILEIVMHCPRRADHATRQAGNFFSLVLFIGLRRGQHAVRLQRHQFLELGKTEKGMEAGTIIGGLGYRFFDTDQRDIDGIGQQAVATFRWRAYRLPVDVGLLDTQRPDQPPRHVVAEGAKPIERLGDAL